MALGRLVHDEDLSGTKKVCPQLEAERCDILERSGGVDPLQYIPPDHFETLSSAEALFPTDNLEWVRAGRIPREDRSEYA